MHRALSIPDIIAAICDTLVRDDGARAGEGPYTVTNTRTLALYARTCRAFHRPAIKVLWKHMELTLEIVLLHCMPSDVWCKQRVSRRYFLSQVDRLMLNRSIIPQDLIRLAYYAPFINTLTFGSAADNSHKYSYSYHVDKSTLELSDEGYLALSLVCSDVMFPNLRHIFWRDRGANLSHIRYFLSPSIISFDLLLHGPGTAQLAILSHLPTRCPAVVDLTFDTRTLGWIRGEVERRRPHALACVCAWNLRHFKSSALDGATLRHLIGSPSLETLYINRPFNPWAPIKLTATRRFLFPADPVPAHHTDGALYRAHAREKLLQSRGAHAAPHGGDVAAPERSQTLRPRGPHVEAPPHAERAGALALHCPELQHLDLDLDATGVIYRSNPPQPAAPHCLPSISMQWSPILSAGVVAGFLSVIFPNLMGVDTVDDAAEVIKRRWKRVGSMVQLFAALRDHERKDALGQAPSTELEVRDRWYMSESEEEDAEDSTD
ncbi:hypothetical protein BD626DRAFT_512256 [Schizophyllum amplum]|uniref:F-box domain-containing protein n=1 Tax=Schizophyllum amplum TaxID=97359 RepID=A0A550C0L8_9AGAR|nr:hypothetical protein BD626DRAFT_512256 [Auriculariopsis ampla]